jgi:hypothetical protein
MKFEDIKKVNETIITTDVKGKQYAEVNQRIKAFRMLYPEGTIETEIVGISDGVCIMRATISNTKVFYDAKEDKVNSVKTILGTGTAYEKENSTFINKTSYIENCETSAVGRALAMCGIGIDTSIASKEEVENAIKQQEENEKIQKETTKLILDIKRLMTTKGLTPDVVYDQFKKNSAEMSLEELKEVKEWLEVK